MIEAKNKSIQYCGSICHYFWFRMEDDGAIVWADGSTITFREEVCGILERMTPGGLPPLGALLLMLAACSDHWRENASVRDVFQGLDRVVDGYKIKTGHLDRDWLNLVMASMDTINALPVELRTGVAAKAALAEIVFENPVLRTTPEEARAIVLEYAGTLPKQGEQPFSQQELFRRLLADLDAVRRGVNYTTTDELSRLVRTGLTADLRPPELNLTLGQRVLHMISCLDDDEERAGLARLARRLMAAVHIPRSVSEYEDMPVGGYSDVSNKGSLDRLLVSELAHDDLVLSVRIALNEALYLRREAPPKHAVRHATVLVDCGIRLWGVPRLFATATALAIAANSDRRQECRFLQTCRDDVMDIDLTNREGLDRHLAHLDPAIHPGVALDKCLAGLSGETHEVLLITHEETLHDPQSDMHRRIPPNVALYLAAVNRKGAFQLYAVHRGGRRLLREARLDLNDILWPRRPPNQRHSVVQQDLSPDLPLILSMEPLPLLLPQWPEYKAAVYAQGYGLLTITRNRRITVWENPRWGAREIVSGTPRGNVFLLPPEPEGMLRIVIANTVGNWNCRLFNVDLNTHTCRRLPFSSWDPHMIKHVGMDHGYLYLIALKKISIFDLETMEEVQPITFLPPLAWRNNRFFFDGDRWYALSVAGRESRLIEVPIPSHGALRARDVLVLFDREGYDGPWGLTRDGRIFATPIPNLDKPLTSIRQPIHDVRDISPDGHRMALECLEDGQTHYYIVDLKTNKIQHLYHYTSIDLYGEKARSLLAGAIGFRTQLLGMGRAPDGELLVLTRKRTYWSVTLNRSTNRLELKRRREGDLNARIWPFLRMSSPPDAGYKLRVISRPNGDRIFMDSRGLLHLKDQHGHLPELSLVLLSDNRVAAWSTRDEYCGPECCIGDNAPVPAERFYELLMDFMVRL